jgi:drug/metabolite transporter (DMT)-like permease
MNPKTLRAEALLLLASAIWGFAFVAQRVGMESIGPFLFNGLRFGLGAIALLPWIFIGGNQPKAQKQNGAASQNSFFWAGILLGILLFGGASLQQIGLVTTTAGKAGFITGLYVLLVPLLGMLGGTFPPKRTWLGAALATWGLYLLSVRNDFSLAPGDGYVLSGAVLWALHVLWVGRISWRGQSHQKQEQQLVLRLALVQFGVCSLLSLLVAVLTEPIALSAIQSATMPLLYGSLGSVSIAYTLQLLAQRRVPAAPAAIILSMETVFAVLGGWLLLDESFDSRSLLGCAFMLSGILICTVQRAGNSESRL